MARDSPLLVDCTSRPDHYCRPYYLVKKRMVAKEVVSTSSSPEWNVAKTILELLDHEPIQSVAQLKPSHANQTNQ